MNGWTVLVSIHKLAVAVALFGSFFVWGKTKTKFNKGNTIGLSTGSTGKVVRNQQKLKTEFRNVVDQFRANIFQWNNWKVKQRTGETEGSWQPTEMAIIPSSNNAFVYMHIQMFASNQTNVVDGWCCCWFYDSFFLSLAFFTPYHRTRCKCQIVWAKSFHSIPLCRAKKKLRERMRNRTTMKKLKNLEEMYI